MYVLIICDLGFTDEITSELKGIDRVDEVHMLNGIYDIIIKMSAASPKELHHIYSEIGKIHGIRTTLTLVGNTEVVSDNWHRSKNGL